MKNLIFLLFFLLFLSCDKDDSPPCYTPPDELPENDDRTYNLSFLKNGEVWRPARTSTGAGSAFLAGQNVVINYDAYEDDSALLMSAELWIEDECSTIKQRILIYVIDPVAGENNELSVSTRFSDFTSAPSYSVDTSLHQKVIITKFDLTTHSFEGTFDLKLVNEEDVTDTLFITDGRFKGD